MLDRRGKPVTQEILTHGQTQTANHDQAQPPVVEGDRARHDVLVVTGPIDDEAEDQRGKRHCLDDGNQRVVAEIAHYRAIQSKTNEQRNGDDRRTQEQPGVVDQRVGQFINAQADHECQPQCDPYQDDVSHHLQHALVSTWQPEQFFAHFVHRLPDFCCDSH
ncbi:hypothetical protein D3C76_307320 [compost metagenome]